MTQKYIQDCLDLNIQVEPSAEYGINEWVKPRYGKQEKEVGYSVGKWSDDDDIWGPITPFLGVQR